MSGRVARSVDVPDDRPVIPAYVDLGDPGDVQARVRLMKNARDLAPYFAAPENGGPEKATLDDAKVPDLVADWTVDPDFSRADVEQLPASAVEQFVDHISPDPASRGFL